MGKERVSLIENMRDIEIEARNIVSTKSDAENEREEKEFSDEFFPSDETVIDAEKVEVEKDTKAADAKKVAADKKAAKKAEKDAKAAKAAADKKTTETADDQTETVETEDSGEKITRDQLKIILNLKANVLKINDQKAWGTLIKKMKFKDVTKANNMTFQQGIEFIFYLQSLESSPT